MDEKGGMVGRGKAPVYSEYTAVYFGVRPYPPKYTGRKLLQNLEYADKYLKMCILPHTQVWVHGNGFMVF